LAHVKGTLSVGYFSKDPKNPKEQLIISSGEDGTVKLWTLKRNQPNELEELVELASIPIGKQPVAAIAASANGKQLIIGSNERSARIYQIDDPAKPSLRHTLSGHASWISYVWLNNRGTRALVATPGGAVSSWFLDRTPPVRTDNTDLLQKFQKHIKADERKITSGVVTDIVSTENGYYSISIDTKVESAWVWETFSGAPVADITREPENKYVDQINTKMTKGSKPNNRKPDNKIKVNEKKSDNGVRVRCARFTSDGKYAITGGQDGKVRVYQLSALRGTE
jgi:WD40 repeat protein